jgi:hypothetical protein
MKMKANLAFCLFVCTLLMSCSGGGGGSGSTGGGGQHPTPLVLARYRNIRLEAIPFGGERSLTTQYGAQNITPRTFALSMPRRAEYSFTATPQTFFHTILESNNENGLTRESDNFTDFEFRWDREQMNDIFDLGEFGANHVTDTEERRLIIISGWNLNNLSTAGVIGFSLWAGVEGEPKDDFERMLGGQLSLYDWKHIRFYVDTTNCGAWDCSFWVMFQHIIAERINNVFRQAAVHVSPALNRQEANVILMPNGMDFWNRDFGYEDFAVRGNIVHINNIRAQGDEARKAAVAMALRFGLQQIDHTIWGSNNLMFRQNANIDRATLGREQWDVLNRAVR